VLTGSTVYHRVAWIALLFIPELIAISVWLNASSLSRDYVLTRLMYNWGPWFLRALVAFVSLFLAFGYLRVRSVLRDLGTGLALVPVRRTLLAGHFCSMALFGFLSRMLFGGSLLGSWTGTVALAWIASGLLAIALACLTFLPLETWSLLFRATGHTWAYAAAIAVLACWFGNALHLLWAPATRATFIIVKFLLGLFLSPVISDPATATIGFLSVQPMYDWKNPKQKVIGYRVTTDVTLKLKDFSKVAPITQQLADANVSETQTLSYTLQNMDEAKNRAVEDAYRRAHNSADTLARASGRALGDLSYASIDTFEAPRIFAPRVMRSLAMANAAAAPPPAPTEEFTPQTVSVTARVSALFNLK